MQTSISADSQLFVKNCEDFFGHICVTGTKRYLVLGIFSGTLPGQSTPNHTIRTQKRFGFAEPLLYCGKENLYGHRASFGHQR